MYLYRQAERSWEMDAKAMAGYHSIIQVRVALAAQQTWKLTGCGECSGRQPGLTALPLICDGQLSKANQSFVIRRFVGATTRVLHTGTIGNSLNHHWKQSALSTQLALGIKTGSEGVSPVGFTSLILITDRLFRSLLCLCDAFSVLISSLVCLTTKIQINLFSFLFFVKTFKPCLQRQTTTLCTLFEKIPSASHKKRDSNYFTWKWCKRWSTYPRDIGYMNATINKYINHETLKMIKPVKKKTSYQGKSDCLAVYIIHYFL